MNQDFFNRYQRQMQLPSFGLEGQQKLAEAKVLVVGMGGLGCPAAQYLAGAGIGKIGLVDGDKVELHNIHRQVLYNSNEVGQPKVKVAKAKLSGLNPSIEIETFEEFISTKNVLEIASDYDIILDGSDRFETRYLLDSYCTLKNKVYVYGSVFEFEGQVALFNYNKNKISYHSIFPNPPKQSDVPTCSENGILGFLPSIIGSMQALELVKYVSHLKEKSDFELIHYNGLAQEIYKTQANPNPKFVPPKSDQEILSFNFDVFCG
jgi:adenylyltransferase/sulfurtransferase